MSDRNLVHVFVEEQSVLCGESEWTARAPVGWIHMATPEELTIVCPKCLQVMWDGEG